MNPRKPSATLAAIVTVVTAMSGATANAAPHLNDTAITYCIDAHGDFIDCEGTGQDATTGRDVTRPRNADGRLGFQFTKLCNSGEPAGSGSCPAKPEPGDAADEWGCTRDEVTGLLWETKTRTGRRAGSRSYTFYSPDYDPDGDYGSPSDMTGYLNAVNQSGLCGAHDWRLPTPAELMGIVDMSMIQMPPVDQRYFPNTASNFYWAGGQPLGWQLEKELAWGSSFLFGLGDIGAQFRASPRPVRLVRGGKATGERFVISADQQEVTDRLTGLTWRRCVEGLAFDGAKCAGKPLGLSWTATLAHALEVARDTGVAWRLPNVKELASLIDHEHLVHIDTHAFPGARNDNLWTSSSFPTDPTPRCINFGNGITYACSQVEAGGRSRLVRDRD